MKKENEVKGLMYQASSLTIKAQSSKQCGICKRINNGCISETDTDHTYIVNGADVDTYKYSQLIFHKGAKTTTQRKDNFFNKVFLNNWTFPCKKLI